MFEALRRMILPIIIIVLVVFMGMIVLQWGLDITSRQQFQDANYAGIINGEEVSWQTFSQTYQNLLENERASRGADYDIPDDRARQLEDEAWNQLVADRLLRQAAEDFNVTITDEDVYQYLRLSPPQFIRTIPDLQTNGQFDYQKYLSLMQDPQAAGFWASIEPIVRDDLQRITVQRRVTETAHLTEEEVRQAFIDNREKITAGLVNASWSDFQSNVAEPSDDELRTYFEAHTEDYPVDERVVLDIVKIVKEPSEFDEEQARARIYMIYDSVTTGSDFAEFAQIYSDDPGSARNGGDLGWFARGRMVKEFDSAAFAMQEGDISTPIKTSFGWHVIKHQGYRTEDTVRQAHVSHILVKPTASESTLDAAWQKLQGIMTGAEEYGFDSAAALAEMDVHTTNPIEEDGYVSYLGTGAPVLNWAFASEPGDVSQVLDLPNVYALVKVNEFLPAGTANMEDIRTRVVRDYRNDKLEVIARDTINLVYESIQAGSGVKQAAEKYGLNYEQVGPFSRDGTVPRIGSDPKVIGAAFGLSEPGAITGPIDYSTGTVLVELLDRQSPDLTAFNEKRDSVYTALLQAKQQQAFNNWFSMLMDSAQIQSNFNLRRR